MIHEVIVSQQSNDPSAYLNQPPSPEEHLLAEQVDLHDGAHVPFWMFAKLAVRTHRHGMWISEVDSLARRVRRYFIAGVATLVANLAGIGGYVIHRVAEGAAAEERAAQLERAALERRAAVEREMGELRQDIRELRKELHKVSGAPSDSDVSFTSIAPDHLILFDENVMPSASCDAPCSASVQCADAFSNCHYCYMGKCSAILPAQPTPAPDAGVDATTTANKGTVP